MQGADTGSKSTVLVAVGQRVVRAEAGGRGHTKRFPQKAPVRANSQARPVAVGWGTRRKRKMVGATDRTP